MDKKNTTWTADKIAILQSYYGDVWVCTKDGADAVGFYKTHALDGVRYFVIGIGSRGLPWDGDTSTSGGDSRGRIEELGLVRDNQFLRDQNCLNRADAATTLLGRRSSGCCWRKVKHD